MLSKKVQKALNEQINAELYSTYIYLSMSNQLFLQNFPGMAAWMKAQATEERGHAMKIYDYLHGRNGEVELARLDAPPAKWSSPLAVFEAALGHEKKITGMINGLVDLAVAEKDHATNSFLQWFVDEQVEEEASALEVVDKLKMVKGFTGGLFMLDSELGQRGAAPGGE